MGCASSTISAANGSSELVDAQPTSSNPDAATVLNVIWELNCGNKRYVSRRKKGLPASRPNNVVDVMKEYPFSPAKVKAIVISDARITAPVDAFFDQPPGSLQVIRICGFTADSHRCGVTGSLEYTLSESQPKVLLVVGNSENDAVESAVRCAMRAAGRSDFPPPPAQLASPCKEEDFKIVQNLFPAAEDALLQSPHAAFKQLCVLATKLNIWRTIETLLSSSSLISELASSSKIELHGAYIDVKSGVADFLGQHPSSQALFAQRPREDIIRTAVDPPVPGEQALASLFAGNARYGKGLGGKTMIHDQRLLMQLAESGQNPAAVVLGCADSRAPIEIIFDMRPGDLFVLRTAGNTISAKAGTIIGSAEYAISHLHTKLVVVIGHTKCGAVTASVDSVRSEKCHSTFPGSIGHVLADMETVAAEAVKNMPGAAIADQVRLATKTNVYAAMERLIKHSPFVKDGIIRGDLHIHGAVYDILGGKVEWLGQHPQLEAIVESSLPLHEWNVHPYVRVPRGPQNKGAQLAMAKLRDGNARFVASAPNPSRPRNASDPFAIVVAGDTLRVPIEHIYDGQPGDFVVQQVRGNNSGSVGGVLLGSLEYAVARYAPAVLVVMHSYGSSAMKCALEQVSGSEQPGSKKIVLDSLMVSAMRAVQQVAGETTLTAAGKDVKLQRLAVELNCLYTIEQLLCSDIIRNAVDREALELHAAILDEASGVVDFIGQHPMLAQIMQRHSKTSHKSTTSTTSTTSTASTTSTTSTPSTI